MIEDNKLAVPISIVVAGLIIAGAVIYINGPDLSERAVKDIAEDTALKEISGLRPIDKDDHVFGNPDAEVMVVEYSDTECPFCKRFHTTMQAIVAEYDGRVAWTYRHFPIPSLHQKAELEAVASECVAELGGNDAFWTFLNRVYKETPSNDGLNSSLLPKFAEDAGVDRAKFNECVKDNRYIERVRADRDEAIATGGRGTPHSIILYKDKKVAVPGAQEFGWMKSTIDDLLNSID